ncbi:MAG: DNA translocase FtsK 4TM domain-containing protein [Campylobacterota bacterium]|nr:DNA translocase FtsK 4TM domain-containing protein [Campylobacterota bacterium]
MKITIIIAAIVFIYLAFSTIFHSTQLAGNVGSIVGSTNIKLFGYLAYINIFLLFYPLYRLFKRPALGKQIDFYAGWLLFFVSMVVLPALIFDKPASGMLSEEISSFLLPYIGKAGMWLFWLMIFALSLVLIIDDDFSFDFMKKISAKGVSVPKVSLKPVGRVLKKIFSNPFKSAYDEVMMPAMDELEEPQKVGKTAAKRKPVRKTKKSVKEQDEAYKKAVEKSAEKEEQVLEERESAHFEAKQKPKTGKRMNTDPVIDEILETEEGMQKTRSTSPHVQIIDELEENTRLLGEMEKGKVAKPKNFKLPKMDFLQKAPKSTRKINEAEIDRKIGELLDKLERFKIEGDVVRTYSGPLVTTFEFKPAPNVKVSKILNLQDDLAMALSAETIRIQAPIPGRDVVGIEIPNETIDTIYLREILESDLFKESKSPLTIALGKDIVGKPFITDLKKLPHLLIAGTTGSGKSVGINAMLLSLLYRNDPEHLKLILIDPKMLEFSIYNDIPHLLTPVIIEPKKAISALANMVHEMERRYKLMAENKVKNIDNFNEKMKKEGGETMPFIVIVIDELADLMMNGGKEVEYSIARLAQMARAAGIHLVVATQRPSVDVVTGLIKANLPSRLSYRVGQRIDSKVILDAMGAESLLGRGDALFTPPGSTGLVRLHAPWNTEEEIEEIVEFLKAQREPDYDESYLETGGSEGSAAGGDSAEDLDPLYAQAKEVVLSDKKTSISYLQRKLQIGYNRSANIIEQLEATGVLSAPNNKGNREIL